ncbi:hypothetical protein MHBO_001297 [Bonamia ostreae]|uniref:Band 7 domain-containing protein n=1 Tax=Bonamia ostreae TaxID=126728 RepID=A0ABV2AII1_9EUKA
MSGQKKSEISIIENTGSVKKGDKTLNEEGLKEKAENSKSLKQTRESEIELGKRCCPSCLSCCLSTVCPFMWLSSCYVVNEREELVVLNFGNYLGTIKEPGLYLNNPCGTTILRTRTDNKSVDLGDVKVVDSTGSPLVISGVTTYKIVNSRSAALNVHDPHNYVLTQVINNEDYLTMFQHHPNKKALAVMKIVVSKSTYDELKINSSSIRSELVRSLQDRVFKAGVRVSNFELTDLSYAKEIAQAMLVRQQAFAMVDARKTIVENACSIADQAVKSLEKKGLVFDEQSKVRLVSNLLVTITGDANPQPTIQIN